MEKHELELSDEQVARLRKALEHVTAHPDEWDQRVWWRSSVESGCGTAGCLAGTVVHQAGYEIPTTFETEVDGERLRGADYAFSPTGRREEISEAAQRLLGLSNAQCMRLFNPLNSLARLWYIASVYSGGRIEVPVEFTSHRPRLTTLVELAHRDC